MILTWKRSHLEPPNQAECLLELSVATGVFFFSAEQMFRFLLDPWC